MGAGERGRERLVDVLEVRCDKERDAQSVLSVLLTIRWARLCFTAGLFFISLPAILLLLLLLLLFITHSCIEGAFVKWKRSFSCNVDMQALIIQPNKQLLPCSGVVRLRVKMSEKQLQALTKTDMNKKKKNKHLSWGRCLKRFKCFFLLLLLFFCPSFSCGHHQGPVPECEVQPPQGVRRQGLPEGHVCQSQETGAKVGGLIPLRVEVSAPWAGEPAAFVRTLDGVTPACPIKKLSTCSCQAIDSTLQHA